jgi:exopolyphosphatase/guanosine-5'-triphosphate,3'-diphosphate pyrophosphatase
MVAIDLGSNTIRAVSLDCESLEKIKDFERAIRLAEGVHSSGVISEAAKERLFCALGELKSEFGEESFVGVTTATMRLAKNSKEILKEIKTRFDIEFEIIDAEAEAYYTYIAAGKRLESLGLGKNGVFLDIGGASSEVSFGNRSSFITKSFDIGIVSASERFSSKEGIVEGLRGEFARVAEFVKDARYLGFRPSIFVSTSGTPTTLAAMKKGLNSRSYDAGLINGVELKAKELDGFLQTLLKMNFEKREKIAGVGRADLIISGVYIYKEFFRTLGFDSSIVIDDSLREGLAIIKCGG